MRKFTWIPMPTTTGYYGKTRKPWPRSGTTWVSKYTDDGDRQCLHHRVDRLAAANPQAIAVESRDGSMTYEELSVRATSLAQHLAGIGVQHGDVVALSMGRSAATIVSMLAVLKAGAAYLPLEKNNPPVRRRKSLEAAHVRHVISDQDCPEI